MCEIPSRLFNTVLTGPLLGRGSLRPDFANRCVKSLAVVLTRCLQVLCSVAAHFRQILPARCVKSLVVVLTRSLQVFCSVAAHFRQIFASRCVKSLTSVFMRYLQAFCLVATTSARFDQQIYEIPRPLFNAVLTGFLLGGGSLPPDFANRRVKSFNPCFYAVSTGVLFGYVVSTY